MPDSAVWPWLTLIGLGAFHGANPGMGWLFAVALGRHQSGRSAVLGALCPIILGHLLSTMIVAGLIILLGLVIDQSLIRKVAGLALVGWGLYHQIFGHRHPIRLGMTVSFLGLLFWSFLMATAHGAGMMLVPALIPLCLANTPAQDLVQGGSLLIATAAVSVHALSMLIVTGVIALIVYEGVGLNVSRRSRINLDLLWTAALVLAGLTLVLT